MQLPDFSILASSITQTRTTGEAAALHFKLAHTLSIPDHRSYDKGSGFSLSDGKCRTVEIG